MPAPPAYLPETLLHQSDRTRVSRGRCPGADRTVIIKQLRPRAATPAAIERLRHEHALGRALAGTVVRASLEHVRIDGQHALILEDPGGEPLRAIIDRDATDLARRLELATALARAVAELHAMGITHRALTPDHVLVGPASDRIHLIDTGLATLAARMPQQPVHPRDLPIDPAHAAPEQTGRLGRASDRRLDLYGLGVTLFELYAGRPPFTGQDPLELVEQHIGRPAPSLMEFAPAVPTALARILARLLEKRPEDRYQDARPLVDDLEQVRQAHRSGRSSADLMPSTSRPPAWFATPSGLYGRDRERHSLNASLEQAREGTSAFVLLSGPTGVGKQELVRRCIARAIAMGFRILTAAPGRADGAPEPHPVLSAFAPMLQWIAGLEGPERNHWQQRLQRDAGAAATVLGDALPELRQLLPPVEPPAVLPPIENEQRFTVAFLNLVRALASREQPLLLVVPDCEQLDGQACRLLALLAGRNGIPHLQVVGITTRPEGVQEWLAGTLEPDDLHRLEVPPLEADETRALVADTLLTTPERIQRCSARIHRHAGGLPARVLQTLEALRVRGHLVYDREARHWDWDEDAIARDLIHEDPDPAPARSQRLERIPPATLACLEAAAAIGRDFDVRMLGEVLEQPVPEILRQLCPALESDLVAPAPIAAGNDPGEAEGDPGEARLWRLRFTSPEIRNAVHEQLEEARRGELHLRIGRRLVEQAGDGDEAALREGVAQLDQAWRLGETRDPDALELARLNLLAGRSALGIARARSAYQYLRSGLGLLGANAWEEAGELALGLTVAAMEAATLCGDPNQVERLGRAALDRTPDPESRMRITALMARMWFAEGRDEEARAIAIPVLDAAGLVPRNRLPGPLGIATTLLRSRQLLRRLEQSGPDRRPAADATLVLGAELLTDLARGSFRDETPTFPGALRRLLRVATRHRGLVEGIHALACTGALCARLGLREDAIRHRLAVERALADPGSEQQPRARVRARFVLIAHLLPWLEPPSNLIAPLLDLYREALAIGDVDTAAHAASEFALLQLIRGADARALRPELRAMETALGAFRRTPGGELLGLQGMFLDALSGSGDAAALDRMAARLDAERSAPVLRHAALLRGWLALLEGRPADCIALLQSPAAHRGGTPGHAGSQYQLLLALAHLDRARACRGGERRRHLRVARRARLRLDAWTGHGLDQIRQRVLLVRAEEVAVRGRDARALDRFERAIHEARSRGFRQDEALAWQRAARLCRDSGRVELADRMEDGARDAWSACGAGGMLQRLSGSHPGERLEPPRQPDCGDPGPGLDDLLADARMLAAKPDPSAVASRLVERSLALTGARRAALILVEGDRLGLAASVAAGSRPRGGRDPQPLDGARDRLPVSLLRSVVRSREPLVVDGATERFDEEPWMLRPRPGTLLCIPLGPDPAAAPTGILYLERDDGAGAFTDAMVEGAGLLAIQTATAIDHARLREALVQARAEFRSLFENAAEGIFRAGLDGRLLQANDALAEALGHAGAESLMAAVTHLRDLAADPEQADRITADLRARGALRNREFEALRRDGSRAWLELSARTVRDEDGQPRAIEGSIIDVTARREHRQAEQAREVAEAATRAKTDFLANMSHEIRTPMNAIIGFADLALSTELSSRQREYVGNIHDAADALLGVINDILDLSRIEAGRMELTSQPLDPAHLFRQLEALFGTRARTRGTRLRFEGAEAVAAALPSGRVPCGDPVRLRQVLVNLVDNALEFTPDGEVRVSVHCRDAAPTRARLDFRVRDDGPGIPEAEQERLFGSFEQLDAGTTRQHAGTGLGLAISRQLVELMGSRLELESAPGAGSTFGFELDLPLTPTRPETPAAPGIPEQALAGRHLLLAEDNRINQQLALEFLQSAGARVTVTETGNGVLEQVAGTRFDAILMDLHMPGLDGIEACRRLRRLAFGRTTPVIAVTADAVGGGILRAREAGFDGHVLKPVSRASLIGTLLRFLPPAESPAPVQDALLPEETLPSLPGLDLAVALHNHNGRSDLLIRLLGDLLEHYGDAGRRMRELVTTNRGEEAARLAHNLYGVAGSFGARRLQEAASALEKILETGSGEPDAALVRFEQALNETLESAGRITRGDVVLPGG